MPRNGAGGFSLASPPFQTATVISSSAMNADLSDIASTLTGSVASDGQTPNIGPLKARDGGPGNPSYTFQNETGSGFYRQANGQIGIAISGVNIGTFAASGFTYNGVSLSGVPSGSLTMFAGTAAPTGWLLCFGQEVSQATFAALFAVIGTTYNTGGEGAGNFRVPDLRGRVVAGLDNMGGGAPAGRLSAPQITGGATTSGQTGGEQTHTLTLAESAAHAHGGATATGTLAYNQTDGNITGSGTNFINAIGTGSGTATIPALTITSDGLGGAHNNVQPTMVMSFIIKT